MPAGKRDKTRKGSQQAEQRTAATLLTFSFRYYNPPDERWCLSSLAEPAQFERALQSLKAVSQLSLHDLMRQSNAWHFHEIDFARTTRPEGFEIPALEDTEAFQFSLIGVNNQKCRVVGAYQNATFYIVWFDTQHQLIPSKKKHT